MYMSDSNWVSSKLDVAKDAGLVIFNGIAHNFGNDITNRGDFYVCQNETNLLAFGMAC